MTAPRVIAWTHGPLEANTYLVQLPRQTLLIDPAAPPGPLPQGFASVALILATHGHFDHIAAADAWRQKSGAPLWIHAQEEGTLRSAEANLSVLLGRAQTFAPPEKTFQEPQTIALEDRFDLEIWSTPGHSPGSSCFLLRQDDKAKALFCGDTLFAGSVGRTDLPGGDASQLSRSLLKIRGTLEGLQALDLPLYPGHGEATTLRQERLQNPYLRDG